MFPKEKLKKYNNNTLIEHVHKSAIDFDIDVDNYIINDSYKYKTETIANANVKEVKSVFY